MASKSTLITTLAVLGTVFAALSQDNAPDARRLAFEKKTADDKESLTASLSVALSFPVQTLGLPMAGFSARFEMMVCCT